MHVFGARPTAGFVLLLLLIGLLVANVPPSQAAHWTSGVLNWGVDRKATDSQDHLMAEVLQEVNRFRAQNGLGPLKLDTRLNTAAQSHSDDMARYNILSHYGRNGASPSDRMSQAGYQWRTIAENIALGQTSPQEVVRDWINSPHHRANLLKPSLKDIGVGYNNAYWTLDLAG